MGVHKLPLLDMYMRDIGPHPQSILLGPSSLAECVGGWDKGWEYLHGGNAALLHPSRTVEMNQERGAVTP